MELQRKFGKQTKTALDNEIARVATKVLKKKQELKSFDTGFAQTVSSSGTVQKLTTIAQGDTDSDRNGDQILITHVQLIITFAFADSVNVCRWVLFRWNQDDGVAAPVIADIFQTVSPYSPYNRDNVRGKKFVVFGDHLFCVGATGPNIEKHIFDRKLTTKVNFTVASVNGMGHLYSVMVTDSLASTHPPLSYIARVSYTDS